MEGPRVRISVPPIWVEHCAPRVFTKILIPVMALLRRNGLRAIVFLDDMLLLAQSMTLLRTQTQEVIHLLQLLGFIVNWEKSHLTPSQELTYLGFVINSWKMLTSLSQRSVGEGAEQTHRHDDSNSAGCPSSPTVLPESTEDKEPSFPSDTRVCLQGESGLHLVTGVDLMEEPTRETCLPVSSTINSPGTSVGDRTHLQLERMLSG